MSSEPFRHHGPDQVPRGGAAAIVLARYDGLTKATSLAFAGPDKRTLYAVGRGNDGPGGDEQWARSTYRIPMVTQGFTGRAK